jgi:hypothetical protein
MFRVPKEDQPPQNRQPGVVQLLSQQRKKKYIKTTKLLVSRKSPWENSFQNEKNRQMSSVNKEKNIMITLAD